ncbi:hypothetical protein HK102_000641 [Quaeritorhiza haematococci]|nr:hypothetical protein HK102_000641 [Quaeritorhiza haematococci]
MQDSDHPTNQNTSNWSPHPVTQTPRPTRAYTNVASQRKYRETARGAVTLLMPHWRAYDPSNPSGPTSTNNVGGSSTGANNPDDNTNEPTELDTSSNAAFVAKLHQNWSNDPAQGGGVRIEWNVVPPEMNYETYVEQVDYACRERQSGMFDVLWVDATRPGYLADCLVDLWEYNPGFGDGHDPVTVMNNVIDGRLVALPAESSFSLLYFNSHIMDRWGFSMPPASTQDFQDMVERIMESERTLENYKLSGIAAHLKEGEGLTAVAVEWLASLNHSSILSSTGKNVTLTQTAVANALARVVSWTGNNVIDIADLETGDDDGVLERFLDEQSVFMRHWSSNLATVAKRAEFTWGVAPMFTDYNNHYMGVHNGWSLGVYKYSTNVDAAVKAVEWLTSRDYQKTMASKAPEPIVPTYPSLFSDADVCEVYGDTTCKVFKATNLILRPVPQTGRLYRNVSNAFSNAVASYIRGDTMDVVDALTKVQYNIETILGLTHNNNSKIDIKDAPDTNTRPGKAVPNHVGIQVGGLLVVSGITVTGIILYRKAVLEKKKKVLEQEEKALRDLEDDANDEDDEDDSDVESRGKFKLRKAKKVPEPPEQPQMTSVAISPTRKKESFMISDDGKLADVDLGPDVIKTDKY